MQIFLRSSEMVKAHGVQASCLAGSMQVAVPRKKFQNIPLVLFYILQVLPCQHKFCQQMRAASSQKCRPLVGAKGATRISHE
jgi:uncharacterized protein YhhL (DUF1145 family)